MKNLKLPLAVAAVCLSLTLARADNVTTMPTTDAPIVSSRDSATDVSMLNHYAPNDLSQESVLPELSNILGQPYHQDESAPMDSNWKIYSYKLANGTVIIAEFSQNPNTDSMDLAKIVEQKPGGKLRTTYFTSNR